MFSHPDCLPFVSMEMLQTGFHSGGRPPLPLGEPTWTLNFHSLSVVQAGSAVRVLLSTVYTVIPIEPQTDGSWPDGKSKWGHVPGKWQDCVPSLEILSQSDTVNCCNYNSLYFAICFYIYFFIVCEQAQGLVHTYNLSLICLLSLMAEFHFTGGQCFLYIYGFAYAGIHLPENVLTSNGVAWAEPWI